MTFGEFIDCLKGFNSRLNRSIKTTDQLNYILGDYVRLAFHDPKHYPKQAFSSKERNKRTYTSDDQRANVARIKYGKHKDGDNR